MDKIDETFWEEINEGTPLEYFKKIVCIPRKSNDESVICQALIYFAEQHKLNWKKDDAGNLVILKNASLKSGEKNTVILQAHMDMVFETIDVEQYPYDAAIQLRHVDEDVIGAEGTTLGADNGLGIAYILAILASKTLLHPPIEALFTVAEEDGLIGASKIQENWLKGKNIINLDGEDESIVVAGCAGAFRSEICLPILWEKTEGRICFLIQMRGLYGGHSGLDIHKSRGNAIEILQNIVLELQQEMDLRICYLIGGNRMNAIPTASEIAVSILPENVNQFKNIFANTKKNLKESLVLEDKNMEILCTEIKQERCFTKETTEKATMIFEKIPNGVLELMGKADSVVKTSSNLGIVETTEKMMIWISNTRSSSQNSLDAMRKYKTELAKKCGADIIFDSEYPAWGYKKNSKLREIYMNCYKEIFKKELKIDIIHAGLECGILLEKILDADAISIGPNIWNVHTVSECYSRQSFENIWTTLKKVLNALCSR